MVASILRIPSAIASTNPPILSFSLRREVDGTVKMVPESALVPPRFNYPAAFLCLFMRVCSWSVMRDAPECVHILVISAGRASVRECV